MNNCKIYNNYILCILSLVAVLLLSNGAAYAEMSPKGKKFTVVVDAGHGGKDIGAADNGVREKDINLGVALQLEKLIEKKLKDANVVMTRDADKYLTLQERADIANKSKGDLFVSIHTNSLDKSNKNRRNVSGSSVYALGLHKDDNNMKVAQRENSVIELEQNYEQKYSGFDPSKDESYIIFEMAQKKNLSQSIKFAEEAQKQLVKSGRKDRGVHQAGFWVLWATSMPAVLVELDFICNPTSAKYMTSKKGEKELAESIFNAIETYYEDWRKTHTLSADMPAETAPADTGLAMESADAASGYLVVASSKAPAKKTVAAATRKSSGYAAGRRKRRSEEFRLVSDARKVEAESIPLHSGNERIGRIEVVAEDGGNVEKEEAQQPVSDKKAGKQKKGKKKSEKKRAEKAPKATKKTERPTNAHNAKVEKFVTVYKIQILASDDLLKQDNPRFCGLAPVTAYRDNNLYKYYYGESQNEEEIRSLLKEVRTKIPDAFIVKSLKSLSSSQN